jgi:hypothetical protein
MFYARQIEEINGKLEQADSILYCLRNALEGINQGGTWGAIVSAEMMVFESRKELEKLIEKMYKESKEVTAA